ncbi:MAG: SDR family NAD(P)-dependent oxidoreductase [Luteimonas sp.]|nr:SDR family NAD(P)-dependent oxidoreductase [Luteimonas sp.]
MRMLLVLFGLSALLASIPAHAQEHESSISYDGKTVLVTGSTDGLGRELALALAADGAHVIVHGRNVERGEAVVDEITQAGKGSAKFIAADFSSLQAVRDFADNVARDYPRLDLLVNNAGIAFHQAPQRSANADGHELQFVVNYLAGWILVNRLKQNLQAAAPSRIINVASGSADAIDFDDVMLERPGAHHRGYGQSKLSQVMMTIEIAPAFAEDGITMVSLHPATLMDTTMVKGIGIPARTTVAEGRDHVMGLIAAPTLQPGAFYVDGQVATPNDPQATDAEARARLVALSAELTGVPLAP